MDQFDKSDVQLNAIMRGLVHELRNPLSAILTASNLLRGNAQLDEETTMLLGVVRNESERMNRILTDFAYFVKPPASPPESFDLRNLVREVWQDLVVEQRVAHNIAWEESLPAQLCVLADYMQMRRALSNVIRNAVDSVARGGTISVTGEIQEDTVKLRVANSGTGFEEGALIEAFRPFYSTRGQSSGLGLTIARQAVQKAGGDIRLSNEPPGAVVDINLPQYRPGEVKDDF